MKLLSTEFVCETRPILLGGNWEEFQYLRPSVRSFCQLFVNFTSKEIKTLIWCQFRRTVDILLDKTTYRKFAIFDILVKCQLFKTLFPGYWNFFSDFKNLSYRCLSNLTLIEKNFYFATFRFRFFTFPNQHWKLKHSDFPNPETECQNKQFEKIKFPKKVIFLFCFAFIYCWTNHKLFDGALLLSKARGPSHEVHSIIFPPTLFRHFFNNWFTKYLTNLPIRHIHKSWKCNLFNASA